MKNTQFAIKCETYSQALDTCRVLEKNGFLVDHHWNNKEIASSSFHVINTQEKGLGIHNHSEGYKVMTLEQVLGNFVLPEAWHIKCTDENLEVLRKWSGKVFLDTTLLIGMVKWGNGKVDMGTNPSNITKAKGRTYSTSYTFGEEITFEKFKTHVLKEPSYNLEKLVKNNQKTEVMKKVTVINSKNEIEVINGITSNTFPIAKEVFVTRNIFINGTERETSIAVLASCDGDIYTGYAIRDPRFDASHNETLAKSVARNRAVNNRSNLTKHEAVSPRFITKQVLRGIADQVFAEISKGTIEIKGVPKSKEIK